MEVWKVIPWSGGFYEVSDQGRIRACERTYIRTNGRPYTARPKMIKPHWSDGYMRVRLNVPEKPKWHSVHKLVMEAFVGPRPEGLVIAHGDGDTSNNALSNLRYATNAENQQDRKRHGTWHDQTGGGALSEAQIITMRERRAAGERLESLATSYGVTPSYVTLICTGKAAAHIGGPILEPRSRSETNRKLTDAQMTEIVRRRSEGEKIVALGKEFGVSHSRISKLYKEATS